jgi:putative tricarboxylic transport membrane protein
MMPELNPAQKTVAVANCIRLAKFTMLNRIIAALVIACVPCLAAGAEGAWKPTRNIEFISAGGAGGSQDRVVRMVQKIAQERKLLGVSSVVVNKPGGGGALGLVYLAQHAADGHYNVLVSPTFASNHILGLTTIGPADVTPLANLFSDYLGYTVRADSPYKDGRELIRAILKNPQGMSIAIGGNLGNLNHMTLVKLMRSNGMADADIRKLRTLAFKTGGETMTALLGGHVDLLVFTVAEMIPHMQSGKVRVLAVTAPKRASGALSQVPTWKEQGHDVVFDAWRMMLGPRGMSAPQLAFWDQTFTRVVQDAEWKNEVEANLWVPDFRRSREAKSYLDAEYNEMKELLVALGMIKR